MTRAEASRRQHDRIMELRAEEQARRARREAERIASAERARPRVDSPPGGDDDQVAGSPEG